MQYANFMREYFACCFFNDLFFRLYTPATWITNRRQHPAATNWRPYWPDENAPIFCSLGQLKCPAPLQFQILTNSKNVYLEFPTCKYVRYQVDTSSNLAGWLPLRTNEWHGLSSTFSLTHAVGGNGAKGFYRIRSTLLPRDDSVTSSVAFTNTPPASNPKTHPSACAGRALVRCFNLQLSTSRIL
jgi:hypothetical protein